MFIKKISKTNLSRLVIIIFAYFLWCAQVLAEAVYFAAEKPPDYNAPIEAPLCYKFMVSNLEEQLGKLKTKYGKTLYNEKIVKSNDGSRSLLAKRKNESAKETQYFYSNSPIVCNEYQRKRLEIAGITAQIFADVDFNEGFALKTIFGNYNNEKKAAIWKANVKTDKQFINFFQEIGEAFQVNQSDSLYISQSIGTKTFFQLGVIKVWIVFQTAPEHWQLDKKAETPLGLCEIAPGEKLCSPVVGTALFSRTSSGWKLDGINKYILEIGQYGSSPRPEFQQLGKETLGFVLKDVISLSFQSTFTWINIIGIQNQKIANLLSVQTSAEYPDNLLANKDEINYESKIKYVDNGNILYDIEIHAIGTNKKGKSIDKVTKYRILGDKYVAD